MPPDLTHFIHKAHETFNDIDHIIHKHTLIINRVKSFALTSKLMIAILLMDGLLFNIAMFFLLGKH